MSLLQEVIEQYGNSENPKAPTDKTDKTSDSTKKGGSVSFGSDRSERLRKKSDNDTPSGTLATATTHRLEWSESPLVQSVDQWSKRLRETPDELRQAAGDDWDEVSNDPAQLVAFADSLAIVQIRESGSVPDHYNFVTNCRKCGDVPVYEGLPRAIEQCMWCMCGQTPPPLLGVSE